jgi:hypothetical protein
MDRRLRFGRAVFWLAARFGTGLASIAGSLSIVIVDNNVAASIVILANERAPT